MKKTSRTNYKRKVYCKDTSRTRQYIAVIKLHITKHNINN